VLDAAGKHDVHGRDVMRVTRLIDVLAGLAIIADYIERKAPRIREAARSVYLSSKLRYLKLKKRRLKRKAQRAARRARKQRELERATRALRGKGSNRDGEIDGSGHIGKQDITPCAPKLAGQRPP